MKMTKPLVAPYSLLLQRGNKVYKATAINVDQAERGEFERRMAVKFCNYEKVEVK